jgi:hypothetical protein
MRILGKAAHEVPDAQVLACGVSASRTQYAEHGTLS